jgi:hypothetical protein
MLVLGCCTVLTWQTILCGSDRWHQMGSCLSTLRFVIPSAQTRLHLPPSRVY